MEVHEMDVTLTTNTPYSIPRPVDDLDTYPGKRIGEKKEAPLAFPGKDSIGEKVREEAIMNLQEVQNFLYMIIGSRLRIENDHGTHGSLVNTSA
jgi:hypothetical protein